MPYVLGVHLGATCTTAAIARRDGSRWSAAVPVPLGGPPAAPEPVVPTALCKVQDGSFVAGEAARQQELHHHEWVVREFTARLGEELPVLVGSDPVPAQRLVATMIEWAADVVAHRQGHPPEHIVVAHSASWGPHRTHLVHQELARLGLSDVTMVTEPMAVGIDYAAKQRVDEHEALVVANVGGTGFDATVLRRRSPGFDVVGSPLESGHPCGQDLDDEIFAAVRTELAEELDGLDAADPQQRPALQRLRAECVRAKEALSSQPGAQIRVELPGTSIETALSRSRLEQLARPHLERVPELVLQAVQSASLSQQDLSAVVLAGGTARVPLLNRLVAQRLSQPPMIDAAPESAAASGAATAGVHLLSAGNDQASGQPPAQAPVDRTNVLMRVEGSDVDDPPYEPEETPRPPVEIEPLPLDPPDASRARRVKIIRLSVAAALIIGGLVLSFVVPTASFGDVIGAIKQLGE